MKTYITILFLGVFVSGCGPIAQPSSPTPALVVATQLPTHTIVASVTAIVSQTTIPAVQLTPPLLATPTFPPPLPPAEAETKVLELLKDNGGCRLPCFWGFTPGQTSVQNFISARHVLGGVGISFPHDDLWIRILAVDGNRDDPPGAIRQLKVIMDIYRQLDNENRTVYDSPLYAQYFQYYSLPSLLTNYGLPENVYVAPDLGIAEMGLGIDLYQLVLDYTESGWTATLTMPLLWKDEAKTVLMGCPMQAYTTLQLWSPKDAEMTRQFGLADKENDAYTYTIEEATHLTLKDFYQQFKDPANTRCLETPMNVFQK